MKNAQNIFILAQVLALAGISFLVYSLYQQATTLKNQSESLTRNQEAITTLSNRLDNTISYMDQMATMQQEQEKLMKPLETGTKAPEFALYNQNNELVSLADYKGKKVTLFFSQKGCQYCEEFYPVINKFAQTHGNETEILILQANASVAENKQFKKEQQIIPTLLHTDGTELVNFKVFQTPTTVIVDADGNIQATGVAQNMEELTALFEQG